MAFDRWRVFLDANVWIAGLVSRAGASAAILDLAGAEEVQILASRQILVEVDRVMGERFPARVEAFRIWIREISPVLVPDPPLAAVRQARSVIHSDDAPILAAAKLAVPDYLVTLDTRHFLVRKVRTYVPFPLVTPFQFLKDFSNFWVRQAEA